MRETLDSYCRRMNRMDLLKQWDTEKNLPETPSKITYGSRRKMWWKCEKGHSWKTAVFVRTGGGAGCPVCAGKIPVPGENDLATMYPEVAAQWHPEKNGNLTPQQFLPGSSRSVWWKCQKGHEWSARIKSRVSGTGCPVCTGRRIVEKKNDLASEYPQLAEQWNTKRNGALKPEHVSPGTRKKVWWTCEKGHEWQASVVSRTSLGTGCPVCSGKKVVPGENDLATAYPEIAAQWHPEKNGRQTPQEVSPFSNRKVWWKCALGHAYQAVVASRTMGGGDCPYCSGRRVLPGFNDLATTEPVLAKQWHPEKNGTLTPRDVTAGSRKKVWWICSEHHEWKSVIYSRTGSRPTGCPVCAGKFRKKRKYTGEI